MTLGLHVDPALERARTAAEWAVAARMLATGRDPDAVVRRVLAAGYPRALADVLAQEALEQAYDVMEATLDAVWPEAKRAYRPRTEDGR